MIPDRKPEIQAGNRPVAQTFAPLRTGNRKSRPETDLSHKHLLLYGQETGNPGRKTDLSHNLSHVTRNVYTVLWICFSFNCGFKSRSSIFRSIRIQGFDDHKIVNFSAEKKS
jgi:hypothetical protein